MRSLASQGLRERVVKRAEAPARSFAIGAFALVCEPIAGGPPVDIVEPDRAPQVPLSRLRRPAPDAIPPRLELCRQCRQYVHAHEATCPHCRADIAAAAHRHEAEVRRRRAVIDEVTRALTRARRSVRAALTWPISQVIRGSARSSRILPARAGEVMVVTR